jgi:hypothetical protein
MPLEHMQVSVQLQWFPQYRGRGARLGASRCLGKAYNVAGVPIHDTKQYSNTRTVFFFFFQNCNPYAAPIIMIKNGRLRQRFSVEIQAFRC